MSNAPEWRIIGVCGDIEIIAGPDSGFTPICRVHEAGEGRPLRSPPQEVAWSHACLICYAANDMARLVALAKEMRDGIADGTGVESSCIDELCEEIDKAICVLESVKLANGRGTKP